jgi:hypothetical protein
MRMAPSSDDRTPPFTPGEPCKEQGDTGRPYQLIGIAWVAEVHMVPPRQAFPSFDLRSYETTWV